MDSLSIIYRNLQKYERRCKRRFNRTLPNNGNERRRLNENRLKMSNKERCKQTKMNYDTWRITKINNTEDDMLENLHYANFLGDKYGDHGASYNSSVVNLKFCDCMREEKEKCYYNDSLYKTALEFDDFESLEEYTLVSDLSSLSLGSLSEYAEEEEEEEECRNE